MKGMSLEKIAAACGGTYYGAEELRETEVTGVVTDSREVEPGFLYIALRGERVDGHSFIPDVFAAGAAAVVSEEVLADPAGPYILAASCPQALKDIAEYYRSTLSIPVVGITGSVGKTSTKEMVSAVLEQKYRVARTEGNFNNEIGLPLTLLRIRPEHEVAVVEMGISDFGEMHRLAQMARPDICVITNIGPCHLENLIDLDGVLRAKTELFDFLGPDGVIVLNGNDAKLSTIEEKNGIRPIRYYVKEDDSGQQGSGTARTQGEPAADGTYFVTADSIVNRGFAGMEAVLHFPDEDCPITEPIPGMHNIYNACAAACVGDALDMTHAQICAGIAAARTLPGRTNIVETGDIVILDDCYNASPNAMRESLDILSRADGRRIAVLGDMLELGGRERELHREVGAYAASLPIDCLYCTGDLARDLADAAMSEAPDAVEEPCVRHFDTKEALIAALLADTKKGDVILVKASHSMNFSDVVEALKKQWHSIV